MVKRPARRAVVAMGLVVLVGVVGALLVRLQGRAIDLEVYRTGGAVWRAGLPLYRDGYPYGLGVYLPFTYPPVAALVLGLGSFVDAAVAVAALSAASLVALAVTTWLAGRAVGLTRGWGEVPLVAAAALAALAVGVEPVRSTLYFGQVNLLLAALVTTDVLARSPRWPRGLLIGIAAAVKLTPLVFVLVLLVRRQWRAAVTAVLTFGALQLVGAVALPSDSRDYWLGGVLTGAGRIGAPETATNVSLRGALARAWPTAPAAVWLALAVLVTAVTVVATWRRARVGDDLGALLTTALGGLLVSPVSWDHHWVWVVPALVWLGARAMAPAAGAGGRRAWTASAVLVAVVALVGPERHLPAGDGAELTWAWWQHLVGNAYVWLALLALVGAVVTGVGPWSRRRRTTDASSTTTAASTHDVVGRPGTRMPR